MLIERTVNQDLDGCLKVVVPQRVPQAAPLVGSLGGLRAAKVGPLHGQQNAFRSRRLHESGKARHMELEDSMENGQ